MSQHVTLHTGIIATPRAGTAVPPPKRRAPQPQARSSTRRSARRHCPGSGLGHRVCDPCLPRRRPAFQTASAWAGICFAFQFKSVSAAASRYPPCSVDPVHGWPAGWGWRRTLCPANPSADSHRSGRGRRFRRRPPPSTAPPVARKPLGSKGGGAAPCQAAMFNVASAGSDIL